MGSSAYDLNTNNKRIARRSAKRSDNTVNWDIVSQTVITNLIESATRAGGAIRFGGTRDNGALALGVYGDGEPYTEYFRSGSELEDFAKDLINVYNGLSDHKK